MNFCTVGKISKPIYGFRFHTHENWEMILQYTAHTVATVGDRTFKMKKGDVIVVPPNMAHNTVSDVLFSDMHIQLKKCDFPTSPFLAEDKDGNITRLFEMTLDTFTEKAEGYELLVEKLSELICLYIKKAAKEKSEPEVVNRFKVLLMENIENGYFDMGRCIGETGYHPDYFRRVFKKHTGCSPLEYLTGLRMERAKELLQYEEYLRIDEVAKRCGFGDSLYFSSRFKREIGMSPLRYRQQMRGGV